MATAVGRGILGLALVMVALLGCSLGRPAPVIKVGLLAPFEGEARAIGYRLLPAIRGATPAEVRGRQVEWVILDTHADPTMAAQRLRELLVDPALLAIVGPTTPAEVEAVAATIEQAGVAWWPLAPRGDEGVARWAGGLEAGLPPEARWGASAWVAVRREQQSRYLDPERSPVPPDLVALVGPDPWPLELLAWRASQQLFERLAQAPDLDRRDNVSNQDDLALPPATLYQSTGGEFPGQPLP